MAFVEKYVTNSGAGAADGSSLANAWSWATMLTSLTAGQRANVQGAITRTTATDTFTNGGSSSNPIAIRGISSTLGDLQSNGRVAGGALVTTGFPVVTYTTGGFTIPTFGIMESMSFTSARTTSTVLSGNANITILRCVIRNTHATSATSVGLSLTGSNLLVIDCDISADSSSSSAIAVSLTASTCPMILRSLITGNTSGAGCMTLGNLAVVYGCSFRDAGFGITATANAASMIIGNSFRNISGVYIKPSVSQRLIANNVAWGVGGSSQWYQSAGTVLENNQLYNFVGNMGVADADLGNWLNQNGVTLTADPFTSSTDLTLNNTSGGGALVRAAGYPAYLDGGAWQHQDSGSGGGMIGGGNLNGGFQ